MEEKTCRSCTHFYQHYGLNEKRIFRLHCGHCTQNRMKRKLPDAKPCEHYAEAAADSERFVSREYFSHALLDYMMKLDLLPEITDSVEK